MILRRTALIYLHVSVLLMGASGIFGKLISTSPFFIVFGRVMFAALALAIVMCYQRKVFKPHNLKDVCAFVMLGVLMAFHWFAFFHSIKISSVAIGLLSFSTFTVMTMFLEPVFFRTRLTLMHIVMALLCFVGIGIIVEGGDGLWVDGVGMFWGLLAALSYSFMLLLNKGYVKQYPAITLTFYQCFVAMFVFLPVVLWMQETVLPIDWFYVFIHGVICTALAFTLYVASAKVISAQVISVVTMLEVLYGVMLAYIFLGEALRGEMIIGGIFILSASYLALRSKN